MLHAPRFVSRQNQVGTFEQFQRCHLIVYTGDGGAGKWNALFILRCLLRLSDASRQLLLLAIVTHEWSFVSPAP